MRKNAVVIGYGGMGGWHTRYLRKSDAVNLLADPAVDFVTIATPNEWYKPLAIAAMEAAFTSDAAGKPIEFEDNYR